MTEERPRRRFGGFSTWGLKVVAGCLLLAGTLSTAMVLPSLGPSLESAPVGGLTLALALEALSWCAVPIYAWLAWTGMRKTTGFPAYVGRVALLALVSEVPYDLATSGRPWDMGSQNPVIGVLCTLVVPRMLDYLQDTMGGWKGAAAQVAVIAAGLAWMWLLKVGVRLGLVQEGVLLLLYCLVFRYLDRNENTMMLAATLVGLVGLMIPSMGLLAVHYRNDKLGSWPSWAKWVFYLLYPMHLLVFALI